MEPLTRHHLACTAAALLNIRQVSVASLNAVASLVRVQLSATGNLSLAEVQVLGR